MVAQAIEQVESFPVSAIVKDPSIQPRVSIDSATIDEYRERMEAGDTFPAIVLFRDDSDPQVLHYLADGWHRVLAAEAAGLESIRAEVRIGTKRDAALHAAAANARHGLRRSNKDKRRAVELVLSVEQCWQWSDRQIAEHVGVHHDLVGNVRRQLADSASWETANSDRRIGRDGRVRRLPTPNRQATTEAAGPRFIDALGNVVPAALEPTWEQAESAWREFDSGIRQAIDALKSLRGKNAGARIRDDSLAALRQVARTSRNSLRPHVPCPEPGCRGELGREACERCKGTGWLPRSVYSLTVPEHRWPDNRPSNAETEDED